MSSLTVRSISGTARTHHHECPHCSRPSHSFFHDLAEPELRMFQALKISKIYPKQKSLFIEGQPAAGVYIPTAGRVKLSACSPDGKVIILDVAEPGDVLGLSAVLTDSDYGVTAEALEPCQVNFVQKDAFINYLRQNPAAGLNAARQLAHSCHRAQRTICSFGVSEPVITKLSKLFLGWSTNTHAIDRSLRLKNVFTHEDMARMIGATRETVTRALRQMRESGLVTLKGHTLTIHDRNELCRTAGVRPPWEQEI